MELPFRGRIVVEFVAQTWDDACKFNEVVTQAVYDSVRDVELVKMGSQVSCE